MAGKTKRSSKKGDQTILGRVKGVFTSAQGFPIFLILTVMAILFVLFRMKSVEIDYKVSDVNKDIEKVMLENKELKAKKAKMLSVKSLKKMAKKHGLSQPKQDQIIVIP